MTPEEFWRERTGTSLSLPVDEETLGFITWMMEPIDEEEEEEAWADSEAIDRWVGGFVLAGRRKRPRRVGGG